VIALLLASAFQMAVDGIALAIIDGTALITCIGARIGGRPLIRWARNHPTYRGARHPPGVVRLRRHAGGMNFTALHRAVGPGPAD